MTASIRRYSHEPISAFGPETILGNVQVSGKWVVLRLTEYTRQANRRHCRFQNRPTI
jgi:hypothetical protein